MAYAVFLLVAFRGYEQTPAALWIGGQTMSKIYFWFGLGFTGLALLSVVPIPLLAPGLGRESSTDKTARG